MPLSQDVLGRLARLGYTTDQHLRFWQGLEQSEGEEFLEGYLRQTEDAAAEYRRWFPRLQAFAAECRRAAPAPDYAGLSHAEREQYWVLRRKMREFDGSEDRRSIFDRKPNQAAILYTNRVGLSAAEEVFAGTGAVVLLAEELDRWYAEVYPGVGDGFWWYASAWWTLREELAEWEVAEARNYPLPAGGSYWVVTSGVQWGSLAGGANHDLWVWDGAKAEYRGSLGVDSY